MVLFSNGLLVLNPLIFRRAVGAMEGVVFVSPVWGWAALLVSVALVSAFFKYQMRIAFISVSREVEQQVRLKLFRRIQGQSMAFFDRHGTGELLSRLTNDISTYRDVLGPGIMYPIFSATLVIPGVAALFSISPSLAAISLIPLVFIPVVNVMIRSPIYSASQGVQQGLATMSNRAQEHYSGIRIIKSYGSEGVVFQLFRQLCQQLVRLQFKLSCLQGLMFPFFTLLAKSITVLIVFFSGMIILRAWGELSPADFVSFMWIQSYIFFPVLMLGWVLPIYERGRAAYDRLVEIYEEPVEVQDQGIAGLRIPAQADLVLDGLSFKYPKGTHSVLDGISLRIKGGNFVGITGPVGAGKSTLLRLLNREYEIPRGMIQIDDRDLHDYPLEAFRQEMVTVEQIPFLFSKSIRENVRFGRESALQHEVEVVAKHADLHDTVLGFPEQYDTVIGERGVTLSGGQKQRVAMARAFLVNRSILLLDDIFSAVDAATEKRIFAAMQANFAGKTVLLVTHRVSILEQLDRVLYMKEGQVVEDGSPKELEAKNGAYAALVALQQMSQGEA